MNEEHNDLQKMITQALEEIKEAEGENFDPVKINLALVSRKTGLSRSRLRRIKVNIPVRRRRESGKTDSASPAKIAALRSLSFLRIQSVDLPHGDIL